MSSISMAGRAQKIKDDIKYYEEQENICFDASESNGDPDCYFNKTACRYIRARTRAQAELTKLTRGQAIPDQI